MSNYFSNKYFVEMLKNKSALCEILKIKNLQIFVLYIEQIYKYLIKKIIGNLFLWCTINDIQLILKNCVSKYCNTNS